MARNQEKAQSMLYRFREAQSLELGLTPRKEHRPYLASQVDDLETAEKWRRDVVREISRAVSNIHNSTLPESQIRDLNDEINKLFRIKSHWETRILELGGQDYAKISAKISEGEGMVVPGSRGYRYFGRAKELPGVRELLEHKVGHRKENANAVLRRVDARYYGYRDEDDDGELLEYERGLKEKWTEKLRTGHDATLVESESESE